MKTKLNHDFPNFWQAILVVALLYGLEILIATGFYDAGARFERGDPRYGGVIAVLGCGVMISLLMSYKKVSYRDLFHPSKRSVVATLRPILLPLIIFMFGFIIFVDELESLLQMVFPMSETQMEIFKRMGSEGFISVVTLCLIAPFVEEILFRGIFLRSFVSSYSTTRSIFYSAVLFGFSHLNIYQFVSATLFGLVSGWLFLSTRSLWPSIIDHAMLNGFFAFNAILNPAKFDNTTANVTDISTMDLLLGIVALLTGGIWLWKTVNQLHQHE